MKSHKLAVVASCLLALVLAAFGPVSTADADMVVPPTLIRVNVSNPAAVTFSATGEFPLIDDSSAIANAGFQLLSLFTSNFYIFGTSAGVSGTLTPSGVTVPIDYMSNSYGSIPDTALNLYRVAVGFGQTQTFMVDAAAFTGVATIDLTGAPLPIPGSVGAIVVGDTVGGSGATLGQWVAVPEPSAFLYGGLVSVLAGCGFRIKRRLAGV